MIPSVDESSIHLFLGSREERLREQRAIQQIERMELGLPVESRQQLKERISRQEGAMNHLATPFPRHVVQRKKNHDVLDIRLLNRMRDGPLPVDVEVEEENEIIEKQLLKLKQTGMHLISGGGAIQNNKNNDASSTFLTALNEQQQTENNIASSQSGSFHSNAASAAGNRTTTRSPSGSRRSRKNAENERDKNYAGDVLFRPGRLVSNLDPSEFWLYAKQKVTQRTLGTQVLQHPVVVGQSQDAESLKQLIRKSPIADIIRKKISHLLQASIGRTRCGILFDLLSTRNIIVSGVPHIVGQFIYEHIYNVLGVEHSGLKFVFVGITDNSNCCAARDVFCQMKTLQTKQIGSTKRTFDALDNVHMFAVPPPGGVEPPLGPAVTPIDASGDHKNKNSDQLNLNRSSPLGMRPWHSAMKKARNLSKELIDPLGLASPPQNISKSLYATATAATKDNLNNTVDEISSSGRQQIQQQQQSQQQDSLNNTVSSSRSQKQYFSSSSSPSSSPGSKNKNILGVGASSSEGNSKYEESSIPHDDLVEAFDPRDLAFLPNVTGKRDERAKKWIQAEMENLQLIMRGPAVRLSKMTKRYNAATSAMIHRTKFAERLRDRVSSQTPQPNASSSVAFLSGSSSNSNSNSNGKNKKKMGRSTPSF